MLTGNLAEVFEFGTRETLSGVVGIDRVTSSVVLEEVAAGSLYHLCHSSDIIRGVDTFYHCSAELVVRGTGHDEFDTASVDGRISFVAGGFDIPVGSMFDVHGDVVDEILVEQSLDHIRIAPVGIKLDEESHILDPSTKIRQISVDGRFSSADHDPVEESDSFFEELEKYFFTYQIILEFCKTVREDEFGIVTEPATEIATRCKYDGCNFAWIIQKGRFFKCRKLHITQLHNHKPYSP